MKRVVIVGGGISGLACAYYLRDRARVTLLESSSTLGGVIGSDRIGGFLLEHGPDSFLTATPDGIRLCRELDLPTMSPLEHRMFLYGDGALRALPEGLTTAIPTRLWPFVRTNVISMAGKIRVALDLVLPRGRDPEDEPLGAFLQRRLGKEALDRLAEPLLAAIHLAPASELSLACTFPRLQELERRHRSLIWGMRQASRGMESPFLSFSGGMGSLVAALVRTLPEGTLRTRSCVRSIRPGWRVETDAETYDADEVVLALPAPAAAAVVPGVPGPLAAALGQIRYVESIVVTLGFRGSLGYRGTGFVVPRAERRSILTCTWSSQKFGGRAPDRHWSVRCILRGPVQDPIGVVRREIREILGAADDPVLEAVSPEPIPRAVYEIGHLARVRWAEQSAPRGLHLIGSAYRGASIPDCIRDGRQCAERIGASPG